ncbi:MAG: NAD(P)-binding protein [Candidatus Diapherotrites archaeon]
MGQGKIAIIGAGPAGMACALELYKANKNFVVIEKENCVGGLSKTYSFGKFKTDNGPHRFFSKNKYLYEMIESLLGEKWIKVNRFTRFYIDGKFYKYPIEPLDVISKISPLKATKIMFDYVKEKLKPKRDPKNFEDYIVSKFGKTLAEFNILNYTEKVWGLKCSELSWEWGEQRIKGLSIKALLKNAFFKGNKPKTLVDQFFYPELGTGMIYEAIREKVETKNKFIFNVVPEKIFVKEKKVEKIVLSNGSEIINPSWVISSIPITELCKIVYPKPSEKVFVASSKLKFRSQVYLFITINKPSVAKDQWIYFPNKEIPLGRISEMKNFSKKWLLKTRLLCS